jgi:parvulin-like peptidyl-prolyl isomerase
MRISRKLAALAAFFVVGGAVAGCGSSIPGNSVANVAGNPITLQAVNHWMFIAAKGQASQAAAQGQPQPLVIANDPPKFNGCVKQIRAEYPTAAKATASTLHSYCQQLFTQVSGEIMTYLIQGYWLQADAHKLGIGDANIQSGFEKTIKKQYPTKAALATFEKTSGQTRDDLLYQYRVYTLSQKVLKHFEKAVTKSEETSYFNAHKSTFGTQETRNLHLIAASSQSKAQAAVNALKGGQSWNTVAKRYASQAAQQANGGLLQDVSAGQEENAVSSQIFANPVGKLVGPIKGILGWYVLEVTKINPASHESFATALPQIKSILTQAASTAASTKVSSYSKKLWLKQTTCRSPYQVPNFCSNYTAPKTATTATPTPSTTATTGSTATTSSTATGSSTATTSSTATATTATKTKTTK